MKVRVSVGNLATRLRLAGTDQSYIFGILNRKAFEQGDRVATSLGGAAQVTQLGKELLEGYYLAEFLEGEDARFLIEQDRLEEVLTIFERRDATMYEIDATREIVEELSTKELPSQDEPIISSEEAKLIRTRFIKSVRRVPGTTRMIARDIKGIPTVRLFNIFELIVQKDALVKILGSPVIYIFSPEQLEILHEGEEVRTIDGTRMGDNIF